MITAVRYVVSGEEAALRGAPLARPVRVFYSLQVAEVARRLGQALAQGRRDVHREDLAAIGAGTIQEAVLERLFGADALCRAFIGTEDIARGRGALEARVGRVA